MNKETFHQNFGNKPIFIGIYTNAAKHQKTAEQRMINGINLVNDMGFFAYIEAVCTRGNLSLKNADYERICTVLDHITDTSMIGINIPFYPDIAYHITNEKNLNFVVNDALLGRFLPTKYVDSDLIRYIGRAEKPNNGKTTFIAGNTPGYLINTTAKNVWNTSDRILNSSADVVLVGNGPHKKIDKLLAEYQLPNSPITKPMIAAQGVKPENLESFLTVADGAISGSGVRINGQLSRRKLNAMKKIQQRF